MCNIEQYVLAAEAQSVTKRFDVTFDCTYKENDFLTLYKYCVAHAIKELYVHIIVCPIPRKSLRWNFLLWRVAAEVIVNGMYIIYITRVWSVVIIVWECDGLLSVEK